MMINVPRSGVSVCVRESGTDHDCGLWTVDRGQWTVDRGLWTVDSGPWTLDFWLFLRVDVEQCP